MTLAVPAALKVTWLALRVAVPAVTARFAVAPGVAGEVEGGAGTAGAGGGGGGRDGHRARRALAGRQGRERRAAGVERRVAGRGGRVGLAQDQPDGRLDRAGLERLVSRGRDQGAGLPG